MSLAFLAPEKAQVTETKARRLCPLCARPFHSHARYQRTYPTWTPPRGQASDRRHSLQGTAILGGLEPTDFESPQQDRLEGQRATRCAPSRLLTPPRLTSLPLRNPACVCAHSGFSAHRAGRGVHRPPTLERPGLGAPGPLPAQVSSLPGGLRGAHHSAIQRTLRDSRFQRALWIRFLGESGHP